MTTVNRGGAWDVVDLLAERDFVRSTLPLRPELLAHCYRMIGSVHEAEDLVQETMLRAWRSRHRYDEQKASLRTWLHAIATNVCLTALVGAKRRPLPSGLGPPGDDPDQPLIPSVDIPWLQPFPDGQRNDNPRTDTEDPSTLIQRRGTLRLALIAAMQFLPPRQRAALILRDVLQFSATEVADMLTVSVPAANSALQRARAGLNGLAVQEQDVSESADAGVRAVLDKYMAAFEAADVASLIALVTDDVVLEMPPVPLWLRGRDHYGQFMKRVFAMRGSDWKSAMVSANGQPAMAAYCRQSDAEYQLHSLQVFTVADLQIRTSVVFQNPADFEAFALPRCWSARNGGSPSSAATRA